LTLIRADINSRTFLLKFGLPDVKKNILVESGFRLHLTSYSREKSSAPSHFVARVPPPKPGANRKLRKALKTRRVTGIYQLGTDRILVFAFVNTASEDKTFYLVLEFFSAGKYAPLPAFLTAV
jgi:predicted ribosome quality control (RQC) complex YloA/Tae2 family protein